jgi:hypothetical protein
MHDDRRNEDGELFVGALNKVPHYLMYRSDGVIRTVEDFRAAVESSNRRAPTQRKIARELLADVPDDMIMQHGPLLPGLRDENLYVEDEHAG